MLRSYPEAPDETGSKIAAFPNFFTDHGLGSLGSIGHYTTD